MTVDGHDAEAISKCLRELLNKENREDYFKSVFWVAFNFSLKNDRKEIIGKFLEIINELVIADVNFFNIICSSPFFYRAVMLVIQRGDDKIRGFINKLIDKLINKVKQEKEEFDFTGLFRLITDIFYLVHSYYYGDDGKHAFDKVWDWVKVKKSSFEDLQSLVRTTYTRTEASLGNGNSWSFNRNEEDSGTFESYFLLRIFVKFLNGNHFKLIDEILVNTSEKNRKKLFENFVISEEDLISSDMNGVSRNRLCWLIDKIKEYLPADESQALTRKWITQNKYLAFTAAASENVYGNIFLEVSVRRAARGSGKPMYARID